MAIYELNSDHIVKINETTFAEAGLKERKDLQRLLKKQIEVIAPDTLVIAEEFGEWEDSKRRIDLLGLADISLYALGHTRLLLKYNTNKGGIGRRASLRG